MTGVVLAGASGFGEVAATDAALLEAVRSALETDDVDTSIPIGLIGCGWIAGMQLDAYRSLGLRVVALCDRHRERAQLYADTYFPDATVYSDLDTFLGHPGITIIDVATSVDGRPETVLACIRARKNVLSQKPFVENLSTGRKLAVAADTAGVLLAVNQNGRWAPHFAALLALVSAGIIGRVVSADFHVAWPHDLVVEHKPAFASMDDLILFDFGAHWFDVLGLLAPSGELEVRAIAAHRPGQVISAPTQAHAIVTGPEFVASVGFRAAERFAEHGGYRVSGTEGVITQSGTSLGGRSVTVQTVDGIATIGTSDDWFAHGLAGAMRALAASVATGTRPPHGADSALRGLELCFAALESARTGLAVSSGSIASRHTGPHERP